MSNLKRRDFLLAGTAVLAGLAGKKEIQAADKGVLTEKELGNMLESMGIKAKKEEKRYDFSFKAQYKGEEWNLTMSTVLSQNGKSIWVMAWLDKLPTSARDVPRTALLRLLAQNDRLGKGKFFAYIPSNKRFVLQRNVPNENMTTKEFLRVLSDLGGSVVETFPHWSVSGWKSGSSSAVAGGRRVKGNIANPKQLRTAKRSVRKQTRTTLNKSKYSGKQTQ